MTYADIRAIAKTGDVFAVQGNGMVSKIIRVLTGESYSHVAMLVWLDEGLFVAEFVEFVGYQIMPASEWVRRRQGQELIYCEGPKCVRACPQPVKEDAVGYRNASVAARWYGYISLFLILYSQITGRKVHVIQKVCSTFVQKCWAAAGHYLPRTADPGDIVKACPTTHRIEF
ncbi:MAG: hypothetical protein C0622_02285 [Desulfuromonas sp.]|nr:MAG: hypothetical protein C0622_02285 [Desulfuromonas sp.]